MGCMMGFQIDGLKSRTNTGDSEDTASAMNIGKTGFSGLFFFVPTI